MNDYNLLKSLYEIHAPSGREKKLRRFLRRVCAEAGASVETDAAGNLLVTKGCAPDYPCVAAHIDQVQRNHSRDFEVMKSDDVIFGYSAVSQAQQGLGADDKNGVWIALEMLRQFSVIKLAFFVGEEIGCVGSSEVNLEFFSDCRFVIQADRRNGGDLITEIGWTKICSNEFLADIGFERYGYKPTEGMMTDVETLVERGVGISCINFSCGYYHPHTDEECTVWSELCNARDFAEHIIVTAQKVYPHKPSLSYDLDCGYGYGRDEVAERGGDDAVGTMWEILSEQPYLTFSELRHDYGAYFEGVDERALEEIYQRVLYDVWDNYGGGI